MSAGARPVTAVVVHFGPWSATERAAASVRETAPGTEILVVDNGPSPPPPGWARGRPGVHTLSPGHNLGYGAACNLAARQTRGDLLFLNNDVELRPGALPAMAAVLEREPRAAAVGPRLFDSAGRPVRSIARAPTPRRVLFESLFLPRLLPGVPFFHGHHTAFLSHRRARDVETLAGAAVLVRREAFEQVNGFDEEYFFYGEESDLFTRLRRAGWRIRFEPGAQAVHHGGLASRDLPRAELDRRLYQALRLYARKFHGGPGERRTLRALLLGARLRWALAHLLPGHRGRERRRRYAEILRLDSG